LKLKNLVAIGKFVVDGSEHIVGLSSYKKGLIMQTLRYEDEVRGIQEIETISTLPSLRFTQAETCAILRLIDKFTIYEFDLSDFADEYNKRVLELIDTKTSGKMFKMEETKLQPAAQDDDLLRLLRESAA
jgi:DNA end-binding protein Ku